MSRMRRYSTSTVSSSDTASSYYSDGEDDDNDDIITIDLDSTKLTQSILAARRTTTSEFQETLQEDCQELHIIASVASDIPDKTSRLSVKIVTGVPDEKDSDADSGAVQHWLHLKTECSSFETFRQAALKFALRYHADTITVLMYLLQQVQDEFEITSAYGSYIQPGTVLRCNGKDTKNSKKNDVSATFVSYPYFDISSGDWPEPPVDDSLHLSRGLFQQHYPREAAQDRDRQQSFSKFKRPGTTSSYSLRVPQLWALIIGSNTLITCGPSTLASTFHESIEFVPQEALLVGLTSLIQLSADFVTKAVSYLPLESCQTFFALKAMIQKECLQSTDHHIDDCILYTSDDNVELDASRWPKVVQTKGSLFISVHMSLRNQPKPSTNESSTRGLFIEYGNLSSDDEQDKAATKLHKRMSSSEHNQETKARADNQYSTGLQKHSDQNANIQLKQRQLAIGYISSEDPLSDTPESEEETPGPVMEDLDQKQPRVEDEATPSLQDGLRYTIPDDIAHDMNLQEKKKTEEKEFQERFELEYRKRLSHLGFEPNQIDAMMGNQSTVNPNSVPAPPLPPARDSSAQEPPTYPMVHRKYLDWETLRYYDIPYQYHDKDLEYIIIMQELDEFELDVLFEHTKRLRQDQAPRQLQTTTASSDKKRPAQNKKKSRQNSRTSDPRSGNFNGEPSWTRVKANRTTRKRPKPSNLAKRQDSQKSSYEHTAQRINQELRVPPFLAWPTTCNDERNEVGSQSRNEAASRMDSSGVLIQITLRMIDERIYQPHQDLKTGFRAASLIVWQKGNNQTTILANSIPRKRISDIDVKLDSKILLNPPSRLENFVQYLETSREEKSEGRFHSPTRSFRNSIFSHEISGRDVLLWQVARLFVLRNVFADGVKALAGQFVPKHYAHPLIDRCWGSISIVDQAVLNTSRELCDHLKKSHVTADSPVYVVRPIPKDGYSKIHSLAELEYPVSSCHICENRHYYASIEDAINHIRLVHISPQSTDVEHHSESLTHWVASTTDADLESKTESLLSYLETLNLRVNKLLSKAVEMRQGVANGSQELDDGYFLRATLVKAAEKIFQFVYYSAYSFNVHCDSGSAPAGPRLLVSSRQHYHDKSGAEMFATLADLAMSKARDDLLLMTQIGDDARSVFHFKASPQFTIYLGLSGLIRRPIMWNMSILQLYRDHLSALRFKASRKPSKLVLRELYLLDEEIEIVESVYMQQYRAEYKLWKVLGVDEIELRREGRDEYVENIFSQFRKDLEKATKALRHNIEITEEGDSKAILIFTLVTIIFLPLSFVASVFGMNTSDIRDMDSDQTLFWAIALPVTITIGTISLIAAYRHTDIREGIQKFKDSLAMKRHRYSHRRRPWNRNKHRTDEERAYGSNNAAIGMLKRRFDSQRSDPWLQSKRWSSRRQKTGSHGPRVLVRTATGKTLHEKPKRRVRTADIPGSSKRY
ncbi:hypothetical protein PSV08DRAFT_223167 [Bipolaris maydis]|nr:hypothetical protein J3E73DRAFT_398018 [Bipolaris maydis]KAJ5027453.1 hypothetical protein J3E73DRAFT_381200 [Bipolaris maydis]KAJ6270648.1 hypothetical protein PSV08DRAFT_223167 [Bipolaris maydis]KAJ6277997.1 hypothetical protein J3E71DRAFT_394023 [Bipolaris maydis]